MLFVNALTQQMPRVRLERLKEILEDEVEDELTAEILDEFGVELNRTNQKYG